MEILGLLLIVAIGALKGGRGKGLPNVVEEKSVFPDSEEWMMHDENQRSWTDGGYYDDQGCYRMPGNN